MTANGNTALARVDSHGEALLSVKDVKTRLDAITSLMKSEMVEGVDYGKIPGTGGKPTLLKPGAEKLGTMFRLDAECDSVETWHDDGHLTVKTTCTIYHQPTGARLGSSSAICSTRETKYAYRTAKRVCPNCGEAAIQKSRPRPDGSGGQGWYCWKKPEKGFNGCGATFPDDNDPAIAGQEVGRTANPDLADSYQTVIRMAEKRAIVAATRQVTAASAIFDEERADAETAEGEPPAKPQSPAAGQQRDTRRPPPPPPQQKQPPPDRKKLAAPVVATINAADTLESLQAFCKAPPLPPHFMTIKDEASKMIVDAIDARKAKLAHEDIDDLYDKLQLDTVKLSLAGQRVGVADIDKMTTAEAVKLREELRRQAQEAGLLNDPPDPSDAEMAALDAATAG